jgi:hypothetical protein
MDGGGRATQEQLPTTPWMEEVEQCMEQLPRATQEQLPTTAWMQEVEQRRSSCRANKATNYTIWRLS